MDKRLVARASARAQQSGQKESNPGRSLALPVNAVLDPAVHSTMGSQEAALAQHEQEPAEPVSPYAVLLESQR